MAMMSSYSAALRPGIDDRKESRRAHAPSTASSNPGCRHTELVLIQPLRNKVSPSTKKEKFCRHTAAEIKVLSLEVKRCVYRHVRVHVCTPPQPGEGGQEQ